MSRQADAELTKELKTLGEQIKRARKERGLSVRDMVVLHAYHEAQWRRYERGSSLTLPSLIRIAKALGTSLSILLDGIGEFAPSFKAPVPPNEASNSKSKAAIRRKAKA